MNKLKLLPHILIGITSAMLITTSFSFAWFLGATTEVNIESASGGVISQYFHCGDGSENNPYVITRPVHLYNLTRLYEDLEGFAEENNHFQLGYDLDNDDDLEFYSYDDSGVYQDSYSNELNMNYYENFTPIGSEENPFGGTFDGSNLTIDNLNISSEGVSDIGVFGYVTESATVKDLYINNLSIDTSNAIANAHNTHDTNAYVGYIAGHIDNARSFTNTYVNNCNIYGNSVLTKNDWGYFGKCENAASIESFVDNAQGSGDDNDWGGSFNSKEYIQWFYNLGTSGQLSQYKTSGVNSKVVTGSGGYELKFTTSSTANPLTNHVVNRLRDGSYLPLKFASDEKQITSMSNTGYLVGSNVGTGVNASPKMSAYKMVNIGNAISNTAYTNMSTTNSSTNIEFDNSKLEILTYSNGWKRIKDNYNLNNNSTNTQIRNYVKTDLEAFNFKKYQASRDVLGEILSEGTMIHGIHFDNNAISTSNLLTIPSNTARVGGIAYTSNYQVPKGSINFSLKESGLINFFAGTYNTSNINLNFFSLNEIKRNGGTITSIKEISQIYENLGEGDKYVYKYSDNTYSIGTRGNLIFDVKTILMGVAPVKNMMYYFEIPVNAGEFAMGIASGADQGAYMIYLDIGANGDSQQEDEVINNFKSVEYRSAIDVVENSILLITYEQQANQEINLKVVYIEQDKRYNITYTGTLTEIVVTTLSVDYVVYFNNIQLPSAIQSHHLS